MALEDDLKISRKVLDKVSRTFALNIPLLDRNKVHEVENQYLLMRFADTIEDSESDTLDKQSLLRGISGFLTLGDYEGAKDLALTVRGSVVDEHDKYLLDNINSILRVFDSFDSGTKRISLDWLGVMCKGMGDFSGKEISNFIDLNSYCYYVAGTVGGYLTDLVKLKDGVQLDHQKAQSFGRFLQKVNIIRDFYKDVKEGRSYWPSNLFTMPLVNYVNGSGSEERMAALDKMVSSAFDESKDTFDYIASIPKSASGYRKFCTLPAVLAMETLKKMLKNPQVFYSEPVKLDKQTVFTLTAKTKAGIYTDYKLRKYQQYNEDMFLTRKFAFVNEL